MPSAALQAGTAADNMDCISAAAGAIEPAVKIKLGGGELGGGEPGGTTDAAVTVEDPGRTVRVLNMGGALDRNRRMINQARNIVTLCKNRCTSITAERAEEMANRLADAELYLDWLDTSLEMTPLINEKTGVEKALKHLIDPGSNVPQHMVDKAAALLSKYRAENWGQDDVADEDEGENATQSLPANSPTQPGSMETTISTIQLPAANDPLFGVSGIMYGIVVDTSGRRRDYRFRTDMPRKSAKNYGHNDIVPGTWYPFQINALFWGAHGARMGGISGSVTTGAWSIVVAGTYEDLDTDHGDTLYYSGSNSHDNTNKQRAADASQGTKALHASLATRNPVRVLRSGGASSSRKQNEYLPLCGLRYDGLYRVVQYRQRTNKNGGLYDQFKLLRLPDQPPLAELRRQSPSPAQIFAHDQLRGKA